MVTNHAMHPREQYRRVQIEVTLAETRVHPPPSKHSASGESDDLLGE